MLFLMVLVFGGHGCAFLAGSVPDSDAQSMLQEQKKQPECLQVEVTTRAKIDQPDVQVFALLRNQCTRKMHVRASVVYSPENRSEGRKRTSWKKVVLEAGSSSRLSWTVSRTAPSSIRVQVQEVKRHDEHE